MSHNPPVMGHMQRNAHPARMCDRCNTERTPEGGVFLSPSKWACRACWASVGLKINRKVSGRAWGQGTNKEQKEATA